MPRCEWANGSLYVWADDEEDNRMFQEIGIDGDRATVTVTPGKAPPVSDSDGNLFEPMYAVLSKMDGDLNDLPPEIGED